MTLRRRYSSRTISSRRRTFRPGRTSAARISSTCATMRPASRISAISSRDFSSTGTLPPLPRRSARRDQPRLLQRREQVAPNRRRVLVAVDARELALLAIKIEQGERLRMEHLPPPRRLWFVVLALVQLAAAEIASPWCTRRMGQGIEDVQPVVAADPAAGETLQQHLVWHVDVEGERHALSLRRQRFVERRRLRHRARKAIEQRSARGVRLGQPL